MKKINWALALNMFIAAVILFPNPDAFLASVSDPATDGVIRTGYFLGSLLAVLIVTGVFYGIATVVLWLWNKATKREIAVVRS